VLKKLGSAIKRSLNYVLTTEAELEIHDLLLRICDLLKSDHGQDTFAKYGQKVFSQSDEDGISLEILNRLEKAGAFKNRTFLELGVGTGIENNSLLLLQLGWRGAWLGGEELEIELQGNSNVAFNKCWIRLDNVIEEAISCLSRIGVKNLDEVDFLSIDLDGNDYHFARSLLNAGCRPKFVIVEINAKFPPPLKFIMPYRDNHQWASDDLFGASLQSYSDLFSEYEYETLCVNRSTGINLFLIQREFLVLFPEAPTSLDQIYIEPNYVLQSKLKRNPISLVQTILDNKF